MRIQAPRGLSAEEKRVRLLEIFHETVRVKPSRGNIMLNLAFFSQKDFYQLKELEKLGPKMKGIGARTHYLQ